MFRICFKRDFIKEFSVSRHREDPFSYHESEGIPLDEHFAERAFAHLNDPLPLSACRYCLGASGKLMKHRQLHPKEVRARHIDEGVFYTEDS